MLESLTTGVVSLDEENRITTINASAARMLHLSRAQFDSAVLKKLEELIGAEDRVVLDRLLRRARRSGHSTEQAQLTGATPIDSTAIPVALTATALRDANGNEGSGPGVVFAIEDLSTTCSSASGAWSEVARRC